MRCPHCGEEIEASKSSERGSDRAIALYYRRIAMGVRRVTLRKIADETGYSYGYLRNAKRKYDRAGKWGAKHKKVVS